MSLFTVKNASKLSALLLLLSQNACTDVHNPINDFEELKPTTIMDAPAPANQPVGKFQAEQIEQGKYLVELLGCGSCHTDGALIGEPDPARRLAGSNTGIAYSDPLKQKNPGIVYPANLTPDVKTGLGSWRDEEVLRMIQSGIDKHGRKQLSVMPWPSYTKLKSEDALAIVAYLRNLPPVSHRVPDNVRAGSKAVSPYVHFGVYRSKK